MLVIHPKDKTTAMLSALYDGLEAQVIDDYRSTKEMGHLLHHVSTQEELDRENVKMARRLRSLLDARIPLSEIPKRLLAMDNVHSPLTTFNYKNFYYL